MRNVSVFLAVAVVTGSIPAAGQCIGLPREIHSEWNLTDPNIYVDSSHMAVAAAYAFRAIAPYFKCPDPPDPGVDVCWGLSLEDRPCVYLEADVDTQFGTAATAQALTYGIGGPDYHHWEASSEVEASLTGEYTLWVQPGCYRCGSGDDAPVFAEPGVAGAGAFIYVEFGTTELTHRTPLAKTVHLEFEGVESPPDRRECDAVLITVTCLATSTEQIYLASLCDFPNGVLPNDATYNETTEVWEADLELEFCIGDVGLGSWSFVFTDDLFDVNEDGRFNEGDVSALTDLIDTTESEIIDRWDLDDDDAIDQDDVDVLQALIDAGLSAGIFGDYNGDGVLDCNDYCDATSALNTDVEDAGYAIELDYDLDGDIDSTDWDEFAALGICAADVTTTGAGSQDPGYGVPDGEMTAADLQYYSNLYVAQDLAADLTTSGANSGDPGYGVPDGNITAGDIQYYVNLYYTCN